MSHSRHASDDDGLVTWRMLLTEATTRLAPFGGASDARRIVEEASGTSAAELSLVLGDPVTDGGIARYDSMVQRRSQGEPLQYVLGHWGFRRLDLMVDGRVLIPRPETEQVVEVALAELDAMGGRDLPTTVVDLGTGSGAIALSVAGERVRSRVWATDSSEDALAVARANLAGLGRAASRVTMVQGSWFEALADHLRGEVDLVVSNPPYVSTGVDLPDEVHRWEPVSALFGGPDGLDDVRTILADAPDWLRDGGVVVCEISPEQVTDAVGHARTHFEVAEVRDDLSGRPRTLVARSPRRR